MRWFSYRPSYNRKLVTRSLRGAGIRVFSLSPYGKPSHLFYATTSAKDIPSARRSRFSGSSGHVSKQQGTLAQQTWQTRLTIYKQLDYESDLDSHPREGRRLVDHDENRHDCRLWLELLLHRRRIYGVKGIIPVWLGMMKRDVPLANHRCVSIIWSLLLELGLSDHSILHQICRYAEDTYICHGYRYPDLYVGVVRHYATQEDPWLIDRWHERLRDMFPPTTEQFRELFAHLNQPEAPIKFTKFMRKVYEDLSIQGMYTFIVTSLCKAKFFQTALEWHQFLVEHKDFPATSESADQIIRYLYLSGNNQQASKITKDLLDAGVPFAPKKNHFLDNDKLLTKETMNLLHGKHYGITPKELSDDFCARLFATRFFSTAHAVKGLEILGTQAIGPKALRELMVRTLDGQTMDSRLALDTLQQLSTAGISIGRSVFARVVKELAMNHETNILHDVVTCDMHFEAFEDRALQESLLHHFYKTGDERGIQRTLAILSVDTRDDPSRQRRFWNYLLRSAINNLDWKEISRILESMENLEVKVTLRSYKYMLERLPSLRRVGRLPSAAANDLNPLINTWQSIMRRGGAIPVFLWSEVLRRLGMNGFLGEYEKLALWLTAWYAKPSFRYSQLSVKALSRLMKDPTSSTNYVETCTMLRRHDARHPLRQLFPTSAVQAIIAWGFQHESPDHANMHFAINECTHANSSPSARWTWGLKLLSKLQALGLRFSPTVLGKACELRLIGIFGRGLSKRPRNRDVQARHSSRHIEEYLSSMEETMGPDLFRSLYPQTFELDKLSRRQAISQLIEMKAEHLARKCSLICPPGVTANRV